VDFEIPIGPMVEVISGALLQKKLRALANEMEQPKIDQELPEAYVSFLELWEASHHPCVRDGSCEITVPISMTLSLTTFQELLRDCHGGVEKRMKKKAEKGKYSVAEVEHAQQLMEALYLNPFEYH